MNVIKEKDGWLSDVVRTLDGATLEKLRAALLGLPSFVLEKCAPVVAPFVMQPYCRLVSFKQAVISNVVILDEVMYLALFREFGEGNGKGRPQAIVKLLETLIDEKKAEATLRMTIFIFQKY